MLIGISESEANVLEARRVRCHLDIFIALSPWEDAAGLLDVAHRPVCVCVCVQPKCNDLGTMELAKYELVLKCPLRNDSRLSSHGLYTFGLDFLHWGRSILVTHLPVIFLPSLPPCKCTCSSLPNVISIGLCCSRASSVTVLSVGPPLCSRCIKNNRPGCRHRYS